MLIHIPADMNRNRYSEILKPRFRPQNPIDVENPIEEEALSDIDIESGEPQILYDDDGRGKAPSAPLSLPFKDHKFVGIITQREGDYKLLNKEGKIVAIRLATASNRRELAILRLVGNHSHITSLLEEHLDQNTTYYSISSAEITLRDAFDYIQWDENYVHLLATSVGNLIYRMHLLLSAELIKIFSAITHLSIHRYIHGKIDEYSIRISFMTGAFLLGACVFDDSYDR
jgi:hypothetical protein